MLLSILAVTVLSLSLHGDSLTAQAAFAKIEHPLEDRQVQLISYLCILLKGL
jgi:lactam utilization protein B